MTTSPTPPGDWPELASTELNGLHNRLHSIRAATPPSDDASATIIGLLDAAESDLRIADACLARAPRNVSDQRDREWAAYAHAVVQASATLGAAQARLDSARADDETGYRQATGHEIDAWQQLLDEWRLQAHLAGMEARDHLDDMSIRLGQLRHALATPPQPTAGWRELRHATQRIADELRHSYEQFRASHRPGALPADRTTGDRPG